MGIVTTPQPVKAVIGVLTAEPGSSVNRLRRPHTTSRTH